MGNIDCKVELELRTCIVNKKNALFHSWTHYAQVIEPSMMKGGHNGGQISYAKGIVEYEDGEIEEVSPYMIKFTDNKHKQYYFGE